MLRYRLARLAVTQHFPRRHLNRGCRPRGAHPHLSYSTTPPFLLVCSRQTALAALHLLASVIAARPARLGCLHRLAVDDAGGWACLTAFALARQHDERVVNGLPQATIAPGIEVALHRRVRRKILRQHPPLAASLRDVEQRIHHGTQD